MHALGVAQAVQLVVRGKEVGVWDAGDDVGVGFEGVVARVGDVDEAVVRWGRGWVLVWKCRSVGVVEGLGGAEVVLGGGRRWRRDERWMKVSQADSTAETVVSRRQRGSLVMTVSGCGIVWVGFRQCPCVGCRRVARIRCGTGVLRSELVSIGRLQVCGCGVRMASITANRQRMRNQTTGVDIRGGGCDAFDDGFLLGSSIGTPS